MHNRYDAGGIRTLAELAAYLNARPAPVLLLEGTRGLSEADSPALAALGRLLAERLPLVRFRSGNAKGADTAFAEGVAAVAPERMEYVTTHAGMGRKRRAAGCRTVSLSDVPQVTEGVVFDTSMKATPSSIGLIKAYCTEGRRTALGARGAYLMRDTLKVVGNQAAGLAPATAGLFYVNAAAPLSGGTGHTIRACLEHSLPVLTQSVWLHWR